MPVRVVSAGSGKFWKVPEGSASFWKIPETGRKRFRGSECDLILRKPVLMRLQPCVPAVGGTAEAYFWNPGGFRKLFGESESGFLRIANAPSLELATVDIHLNEHYRWSVVSVRLHGIRQPCTRSVVTSPPNRRGSEPGLSSCNAI